jgi:Endonuclease/Exonuclease/phosphatase family 2
LDPWIPRNGYDIYAISSQECEYAARDPFEECESDWFGLIQSHLGSNYVKLAGLSLWTIRLIVLIRRDHYYAVSHIQRGTEATGIAHVIGNKGGVGRWWVLLVVCWCVCVFVFVCLCVNRCMRIGVCLYACVYAV